MVEPSSATTSARRILSPLPVADPWFRSEAMADGLTRIEEPHVSPLLRANIWHLRGRDRDLVVDTGCGIASLRSFDPSLFAHDPAVVLTHAHLDHSGGAAEFERVLLAPGDAWSSPIGSLLGPRMLELLGITQSEGLGPIPPILIDAVPHAGFDVAGFTPTPPRTSDVLSDGALIDLGDRAFTVLHLPGHSPASICLFDEHDGTLFSGDVVYDDELLVELDGGSLPDYIHSLERLESVDVRVAYPGHDATLDAVAFRGVLDRQLRAWGAR